jgi:Ca2+-binding RTX toxin-like protein
LLRGQRFWIWIQGAAAVGVFGAAVASVALVDTAEVPDETSVQCLVPESRVVVILRGDGAGATITHQPDGDLVVGGERCLGANLERIELIRVIGGPGSQSATLYLGNGPFSPGSDLEGDDSPEVGFEVALGEGEDGVTILGGEEGDHIGAGTSGLNLNAEEAVADADVTLQDVERVAVRTGAGDDTVTAAGGAGTGGAFGSPIEVDGGLGNDELIGGTSGDRLVGSADEDVAVGGLGNDVLLGDLGDDDLDGGEGDDVVDGGEGGDILVGGSGIDQELGGDGDDIDRQAPSDGGDVFEGGEGTDLLSYRSRAGPVTVTIGVGADDGEAGEADDIRADVERVRGGSGDDVLTGGDGANDLFGAEGDDRLAGARGDDILRGGTGEDAANYVESPSRVRANLVQGRAFDDLGGRDRLMGIEGLVGGFGEDVLIGDGDGNSILGGPGTDRLEGSGGNDELGGGRADDVLHGGDGADTLVGAQGDDDLHGGPAVDTASYEEAAGAVTADLAAGEASDGEAGTDTLAAIEAVRGSPSGDVLGGGGGADLLSGGLGDDTLAGRGGDDELVGGVGADIVDYTGAKRGVEVDLRAGRAADDGDGGVDLLRRVEHVSGGPRGDDISGNGGDNRLAGGGGDDLISGGGGADDMSGGDGIDAAVYEDAPSGVTVNLRRTLAPDDGTGARDGVVSFEEVVGSAFDDAIVGDSFANLLMGGDGDDRLAGGVGGDRLEGRAGDDQLDGSPGFDRCIGGQGTDAFDRCEIAAQ